MAVYGIIYKISYDGSNIYIGQTRDGLAHRMSQHKHAIKAGHGDGQKFIAFYKTHDFDHAIKEEIDTARNKEELNAKECKWIQHYDSICNGLNSEL